MSKEKIKQEYKCTNCHTISLKRNNNKIRVGFCDNCKHPLWNEEHVNLQKWEQQKKYFKNE